MGNFASVSDMARLWRKMSAEEEERAKALLPVVSNQLRVYARRYGHDLDAEVEADKQLRSVARSVTVDVVARALMTSTDSEPMSQMTQTAGVYSASGTFLVPGGGLFIKKSELERLGLRRQKFGVIDFYGTS